MEKEKIQQIILKSTSLSNRQAEKILNAKDDKGKTLLEHLSGGRKTQSITPETALSRMSKHLRLPFLKDIPSEDIPPSLVSSIPINYAKAQGVLASKGKRQCH